MERTHYYFCWFNNGVPERIAELLRRDLTERKSLVSICTNPSEHEYNDRFVAEIIAGWLDPAGLVFDEYHLIDYRVSKKAAQALLRNASAVFLHGGDPFSMNAFLEEYELAAAIKESNAALIMGGSAGMMNMCARFVCDKRDEINSNGKYKEGTVYTGLGLDDFAVAEVRHDINEVKLDQYGAELLALSEQMLLYAVFDESTIRSKHGKLEFAGNVYLVSGSDVKKVDGTLT